MHLYFSVKPEYRTNGVWMVNDENARTLHTLEDADGNYLWNPNSNTIMGKEVIICNDMPTVGAGNKPIAFGDFSYYWIINRSPLSARALIERFALNNKVGYLANEYLDARLIRQEAIKVLKIN